MSGAPPSVAVIGAGVAGLQACRSCRERGLQVVCFDAEEGAGGQWFENYTSLRAQVPKELYEFPDFENHDVPWGKLPSAAELRAYCQKYAEHFELCPLMRYSTEVVGIEPRAEVENPGWVVKTRRIEGGEYKRAGAAEKSHHVTVTDDYEFDFVLLCTGPFSHRAPNVPELPGMTGFQGTILHSSENVVANAEKGKHVIVVGGAKSAHDSAVLAVDSGAASVTQLMRRAHWSVPQNVLGVIPFENFFCSRFGEGLMHTYQGGISPPKPWTFPRRLMQVFMFPIAWGMVKSFESLFLFQNGHYGVLRPQIDMMRDVKSHGHCSAENHAKYRKQKKIDAQLGTIESFMSNGVNVKRPDGTVDFVAADMVIFGTGFKRNYNIFPEDLRARLGDTSYGLALYRQILHPEFENLAWVGANITISHIVANSLQAEWCARWIAGDRGKGFRPTKDEMYKEMQDLTEWKLKHIGAEHNSICSDLQQTNYCDVLLEDMGESTWRKFPNVFAEWLLPYRPVQYNGIVGKPLMARL